jgi:hypothetical protein
MAFPGQSGRSGGLFQAGVESEWKEEFAEIKAHELPFDCLAVGQQFAVDLPRESVIQWAKAYIRENPGSGFAFRREDGQTTCIRLA